MHESYIKWMQYLKCCLWCTKIGDAFIGAAAESTSLPPFICPGTGNYPVPGKECTGVFISCSTGVPVEEAIFAFCITFSV